MSIINFSNTIVNTTGLTVTDGLTGLQIQNTVDTTKYIAFDTNGNTSGFSTVLTTAVTANRVITFPDASDTVVTLNAAQTLTNKVLTTGINFSVNPIEIGLSTLGNSVSGGIAIGSSAAAQHANGIAIGTNSKTKTYTQNVCIGTDTGSSFAGIGFNEPTNSTLVGYRAGRNITTGASNTCVGSTAGSNITGGYNNTIIGNSAGNAINGGTDNVIIGHISGTAVDVSVAVLIGDQANAQANGVVAVGFNASASGLNAVSIGAGVTNSGASAIAINGAASGTDSIALRGQAQGTSSISVGVSSNTYGAECIAIGPQAGGFNISQGQRCIDIGYFARSGSGANSINIGNANNSDNSGGNNVCIGTSNVGATSAGCVCIGTNTKVNSGNSNSVILGNTTLASTGGTTSNVYIGNNAGANLVSGTANICIGDNAQVGNIAFVNDDAIAIGRNSSAYQNSISVGRDAIGSSSFGISIGHTCYSALGISIGSTVASASMTGAGNIIIGNTSGAAVTTGAGNVSIGASNISALSTGNFNTCLGSSAGGANLTTGANNMCLGFQSNPSAAGVSNEITLGNGSIATIRAQVTTITALSDRRDKKNILDIPLGLDFINAVRPVSFDWNMRDGGKVDVHEFGFIAQELQEAESAVGVVVPNLVYDKNPERLEVGQGALLPVMVKAIQELNNLVRSLSLEVADLRGQLSSK